VSKKSTSLGTQPISKLLIQQAVPASIGILVMSLNMIVDTIFVGRWIGPLAISAITVVIPVTFFIAAIGLALGVGGSSVLSRALGSGNDTKALSVFGNQVTLTFFISGILAILGLVFQDKLIAFFGADDSFKEMALTNIGMDYLLINVLGYGMEGAAWATFISYAICFSFILWFFIAKSELRLTLESLQLKKKIVSEISGLSGVTLARQGVIAVLTVLLNNVLITYGDGLDVASYGIISRMLMFALFPVIGVAQGFMPIASYNYGAHKYDRVRESISTSIKYAGILALIIFTIIMIFPDVFVSLFLSNTNADPETIANNNELLKRTPNALRWVFAATPVIIIQLIGSIYFQAIGKAVPALFLSLTKQGFFLIPLILILPPIFGVWGVWIAFPIADALSTIVTGYFLRRDMKNNLVAE